MADADRAAFVAETAAALVTTFGDAVVVTRVDELQANLVFYDMIPGRVSAVAEGLLGELFVGPPDGPERSWEPLLIAWQSEEGTATPEWVARELGHKIWFCVPDHYLEQVFSKAYTQVRPGYSWTRKVKEGS